MWGGVGPLGKKREGRAAPGRRAQPMFTCMGERGPDSGGMAVFGEPGPDGRRRYSLFVPDPEFDWQALLGDFRAAFTDDARIEPVANHAVLVTSAAPEEVR